MLQRTTTTGGADDTVEIDSRGRPIRRWWYGPAVLPDASAPPRLMQEIEYNARGEQIARRSVPVREDTPESQLLFDVYEFDALGREVRHTTPWSALVQTSYDGAEVQVTDALGKTRMERDPLERPILVTDAALGVTKYTYGPFGALSTVTDPGGALTRTTHDAYGRVRQLDDPDQGTTVSVHDGFGELVSSTDALGRIVTLEYDALGRTTTRLDQDGPKSLTTTWTWDKAAHGIGQLLQVASPDGQKTYTYNELERLETLTLNVTGMSDSLMIRLDYDPAGRVATITSPFKVTFAAIPRATSPSIHGECRRAESSSARASWGHADGA